MIERRLRVYPRIVLAMSLLAIPVYALTFDDGVDGRGRPIGTDFIAFWSAGRLALDGRVTDAWDLGAIGAFQLSLYPDLSGPTQWAYPPTTLPLVIPFGAVPHPVAYGMWVATGLAVFLLALRPLLRGRPYAWPLALAFPGLWLGIPSGQIQFFVAALLGGALVTLPRRPVLAGVLIGLLVIKPQLAVAMPLVLLAGREWRAFASAAVTSVIAVVTTTSVFGVQALESWRASLGDLGGAIGDGSAPVYKFVTPYMGLRLLGLPLAPSLALHAVVAAIAGWTLWQVWRRCGEPAVRGAAAVVATFLITPYAADYDLAVIAFAIAWMAILGLDGGWLRGDRNLLVVMWLLPAVAASISLLTLVNVTPFVMAVALQQLWRRSAVGAHQPVVRT